ncbi:Uma2 family endonuclease [Streptomyces sp. NBC_00448]|uniref:Uma2 family endonuclease n=1 Tax=Streptomyces sp. NBC_00448 TaxID=2903652 RepID=UPI002E230860
MTAVDDRLQAWDDAQMLPETFEDIAALAARDEEGLCFELIGGKLGVKRVPDAIHEAITMWLLRQCIQQKPQWDLHTGQGLKVESYRNGRARPDGTLAPVAHFVGRTVGEWADPDGVLMAVEVTLRDRDTNQRDRVDKPRAYAESGIPVYLLIDRDRREVSIHSDPQDGAYRDRHVVAFGKTVALPEPVGIELDTRQLLEWTEGAAAPES